MIVLMRFSILRRKTSIDQWQAGMGGSQAGNTEQILRRIGLHLRLPYTWPLYLHALHSLQIIFPLTIRQNLHEDKEFCTRKLL